MLLEFRMSNVKSFKEEMVFKMTPAQKITDLNYSVIHKNNIRALPTAVIYGPNAGGKTNIIGGMEILKNIILRGHIENVENINSLNFATADLEYIPNIKSEEKEPTNFYIKFMHKDIIFEYELKLLLGSFMNKDFERKILLEQLNVNNKIIYTRKDISKLDFSSNLQSEYLVEGFSDVIVKVAEKNLEDKELFLCNMFKNAVSKKIYDIIIDWFKDSFNIIYRADQLEIVPETQVKFNEKEQKKFQRSTEITNIAKNFGSLCHEIIYPIKENKNEVIPLSVVKIGNDESVAVIPSEIFESLGTVRFINIFPLVKYAIEEGKILVIDEFDNSLHPMVIMNLIMIFHNDEINKKGAQLIFNTHNPIFLNHTLFRRDEIHFVEKDKEKYSSIHYILSDFGTSGKNGVRKGEDYMKNYFINKYGAIENIDFSEVFDI